MPGKAQTILRNRFISGLSATSRKGTDTNSTTGDAGSHVTGSVSVGADGAETPAAVDNLSNVLPTPMEHPDPLRHAVPSWYRRRGWFWRLVRRITGNKKTSPAPAQAVVAAEETAATPPARAPLPLRRFFALFIPRKREPLPEELALKREAERRKELNDLLVKEAGNFNRIIINVLDRRELCYRYKKSERDLRISGVQSVHFEAIKCYPEAFYFFVDLQRLPRGIDPLRLLDETVLTDLSLACQHRVSGHYSPANGCVLILERATGAFGIPNHVKVSEMWEATPAYADGLSIPFGMSTNARPIYKSLSQIYSMLIAGTIRSGKSNFANLMLCTLIRRNPSDRLKLLLVDLKGGIEFSFYEGIPHLLPIPDFAPTGICSDRANVPGLLAWLLAEVETRIERIKQAGYKNIGAYNAHFRKSPMAHIVFVADEWADVQLDPKIGRKCEDILTNIASRCPAVGVHIVICTQTPKREVISTRIKSVLPAKLAFSVPTNTASIIILDNDNAKGLEPQGRSIFQWVDGEVQIQTPFIPDETVRETVEGAKAGIFEKISSKGHDVTNLEIWEWSLVEDSGWLRIKAIYTKFKSRGITYDEVEKLVASWRNQEIVIGSSLYRVEPPAGPRASRLIAIDVPQEAK